MILVKPANRKNTTSRKRTCDTFALGQIDKGIRSERAQRARQIQELIWTPQSNWIGDRVVNQAAPGQNGQRLSDGGRRHLVG